jgi:signal transduction histidine kinase
VRLITLDVRAWAGRLGSDLLLLPLLCALDLLVASSVIIHENPVGAERRLAQVGAAVLGFAVLAWRHRAPVLVFAVECGHAVAVWLWLHDYRPTIGLIVALYAVASARRLAISVAALLAAVLRAVPNAVDSMRFERHPRTRVGEFVVTLLMFAVIYAAAWAIGVLARGHRLRVRQLELDRLVARDEAVSRERERMAAELHDVVSHSVTVMVLQAAGAARLADTETARVREALLHIQDTGQQAMAELRRLLGVLPRSGVRGPAAAGTGPQPRLVDVEVLLASLRQAGLRVELRVTGTPAALDPSVELAAYRVVQESLTNTLKHAGTGARAEVRLAWEDQVLLLRVDDDGKVDGAPPAPGMPPGSGLSNGYGLVSLAERVRGVGGRLSTGARPDGGYRVSATLPLAHRPAAVPVPPGPS